jgi:hypothetical protein
VFLLNACLAHMTVTTNKKTRLRSRVFQQSQKVFAQGRFAGLLV